MYINVAPKFETHPDEGYVCRADNGDLPFEGRIHATIEDAMDDLNAAYDNTTWQGRQIGSTTYEIQPD